MQPTTEQQTFLDAEGKVVLCACPGSGKTFVVGKKLLKYLADWEHPYRGVAVLSFTNVASDEILRQASELRGNASIVEAPHFVGTLDSFIDSYIFLRFGYLMQCEPTQRKRPKILFKNCGRFQTRNSECYRCDIQDFHWSSNQLLKNGKAIDCNINPRPCESIKRNMLQKGLVTQKEVPALALRLMQKYPEIAKRVAHRFPIIIVDEAQDTSKEQMDILDLLATNGVQTLILVGDPDQAIYEWRDATPEFFKQKMMDAEWMQLRLSENFRSSQHICTATATFSSTCTKDNLLITASGDDKNFARKPILFKVKTTFDNALAKFKEICKSDGVRFDNESVAILTRYKIYDGFPNNLWKHDVSEWLAAATFRWYRASKREAFLLCEKALFEMMIGEVGNQSHDELKIAIENVLEYSIWKQKVIALLKTLPHVDSPIKDWRQNLIVRINAKVQANDIVLRAGLSLEELIKTKVREKTNGGYSSAFLDRPLLECYEKKAKKEATVSSIHGVKGESYDAVFLRVDKTKGGTLTPSSLYSGVLDSELLRIAYVAMTRPRKLLAIAVPKPKATDDLGRFPTTLWEHIEI